MQKVAGVVTDCAFARLSDVVEGKLRALVPSWVPTPILKVAMQFVPFWCETIYGYDLRDVAPEDSVRYREFSVCFVVVC